MSLRAAGELQATERVCEATARALAALGVPLPHASLAVVAERDDSSGALSALAHELLRRGVARVRFVDADVAAMLAAREPTGISIHIGAESSTAAALVDGRLVQICRPHAGGAMVGAAARQTSGARAGALRLPVGVDTALDALCAALSISADAHDARDELRVRMRETPLCYVRAIAPARRPVRADELEIGRMDVALKSSSAVVIDRERFGCLEHWFGAGGAGEADGVGGAGGADGADGLVQLLGRALKQVGDDDAPAVFRRIVLHGEGARIRGVDQRLANELRHGSPVPSVACVRPVFALGVARAHLATWVGAAELVQREERPRTRTGSGSLLCVSDSAWIHARQLGAPNRACGAPDATDAK